MHAKTLIAAFGCSAVSACSTLPCHTGAANDVAAVGRVVDAFGAAIVNKDKPAYMSLFFSERPDEIGWQAVVDDPKLQLIRQTRPQAIKARRIPTNNFVSLIDGVVASKTTEEERISGVCVHTDGEVASVVFNYVYYSDAKATNHGDEHWQLVRTEGGWKIYSVIYTIRDP